MAIEANMHISFAKVLRRIYAPFSMAQQYMADGGKKNDFASSDYR
ncbi:MAG: hypothetical protein Q7K34_03900 [archaeon]|nr:hypothetical protein [archaeon]